MLTASVQRKHKVVLLNVEKLHAKGFAVFIYLAAGCGFNVVLERMFEVLLAAASPPRFQRLLSMEGYRNWLYRMVCAFDFLSPKGG